MNILRKIIEDMENFGFNSDQLTYILDPIDKEERINLFKEMKKKECYFCKGKHKGKIVTLVRVVHKDTREQFPAQICHVCYNQFFRLD